MENLLTTLTGAVDSTAFGTFQLLIIGYIALLWLSIIIWVTRDVLARSGSLFFQAFSILLNIVVPILGVLLYLIIRPSRTQAERYYEELEAGALETEQETEKACCQKCLISVETDYFYCPNCGHGLKRACEKCKKSFPNQWNICPFCGKEHKMEKVDPKKTHKKLTEK